MIADETGKIVIWLNATPNNTVGQYLKVKGKLAARNGNMQYTNTCTISVLNETAPTISETVATWTSVEADNFIATAQEERGIGQYISFTGQLSISGFYYNVAVEGTNNQFSLGYLTNAQKEGLVSGNNYTFTGYVTDVSSGKYVNIYYTSYEAVEFSAITSFEIDGNEAIQMTVGGQSSLNVSIAPALANKAVEWSTSDANVVDVKDGQLTAKAAGKATITATSVGKDAANAVVTDTVEVTVVESSINTQSETYTYVKDTFVVENKQVSFATDNVNYLLSQASSTTAINTTANEFRFYVGSTLKISSEKKIAKIEFHTAYSDKTNSMGRVGVNAAGDALTESQIIETVDTAAKLITYNLIDAGFAKEVTFTCKTQNRISKIVVTYVVE